MSAVDTLAKALALIAAMSRVSMMATCAAVRALSCWALKLANWLVVKDSSELVARLLIWLVVRPAIWVALSA